MTMTLNGSAAALLLLTCASPVLADETMIDAPAEQAEPIIVTDVSLYPAAGLMNEHTHDGGEAMIGLRYAHNRFSGPNRSGTDTVSDAEILAAAYTTRAARMEMDMVMLDIMYAPNDKVTLMVMPHWMRHEMTMVGIDPANTGMGMDDGMGTGMDMPPGHDHGHGLALGQTMTHTSSGFGDTLASASYRLANTRSFKAHATFGVWIPTGEVARKNPDGTFLHYGMQGGSGTWDIEPSLTVSGRKASWGWGAQAAYRWRSESENKSGFVFGDRFVSNIWTSYAVSRAASLTGRLGYEHEGAIEGHYNGPHNHATPADRQQNYGGDTVLAAFGANIALPLGGAMPVQLGFEGGVPIYQNLNGIQQPEKWRFSAALTTTL